jgi:hypothetical protein
MNRQLLVTNNQGGIMAKKPEKKSSVSKAKTSSKSKPKTMATKRAKGGVEKRTVRAAVAKTGAIFRSIVDSVLTQKRVFTSEDIVSRSKSSPRHSRRTLAYLVKHNALSVNRSERPYRYQVSSREALKRLSR